MEAVRPIQAEIDRRVRNLLAELDVPVGPTRHVAGHELAGRQVSIGESGSIPHSTHDP